MREGVVRWKKVVGTVGGKAVTTSLFGLNMGFCYNLRALF